MVIRYNLSMEKEIFGIIYKEIKKMLIVEKNLLVKIKFIV